MLRYRCALIRCVLIALALVSATRQPLCGQERTVPELTDDQRQALSVVTQGRVLSTISFLASDELAGRDTPSRELTIAAAFVASRFRGAGLEPVNPDGSFYQSQSFSMTQPPAADAVLTDVGSDKQSRRKVLAALGEETSVSGKVISEADAADADSPEIVLIKESALPPQALRRPSAVTALYARRTRKLAEQGVKVVLVACGPDSRLSEVADQLNRSAVSVIKGLQPQCCIVPVAADEEWTGKEVRVAVDAQRQTEEPVRNVIGVLKGSDEKLSEEAVFITAHLDHIGRTSSGADLINNGADDNATGVTAVLSRADVFGSLKQKPKRSVVFMTFWGEEKGLRGSKAFVEDPLWPLAKIAANINIEMVGRPEEDAREKAWMTGWKHSDLGELMNAGSQRVGVEIFNRTDVGEMLYSRSDNYAFVRKGVVAHSFSAGSLHADYHQPSDEWQKLDIPHMTKVIHGLFAGALAVANTTDPPARK